MLARASIVPGSTFSILLLLISVGAQHHVVNNHFRRDADTNESFERITSLSSAQQRRAVNSPSKASPDSFSPVKRDFLGTLLADGSDPHEHEGFVQGIVNGIPDYNACRPDGPIPSAFPGDPPFTQGRFSYEKAITCPNGIHHAPNGIVLLIPGTGCDGAQTYAKGPFGVGLPRAGFDICWLDPPSRLTVDIQLTAEFIAYAVLSLARQSPATGGRIGVVTYSQGGLATQWALTFWASVRQAVGNFVAIAAPFQGTILTQTACGALDAVGGCDPALLQMSTASESYGFIRSEFAHTLRAAGGQVAKVSTTSIFTLQDDLVVPQRDSPEGVSFLSGASNIPIQKACRGATADHFGIIVSTVAYGIALDALLNRRPASLSTFNSRFCHLVGDLVALAQGIPRDLQLSWRGLIGNPSTRVHKILTEVTTLSVPGEPKLQVYVCHWGLAHDCASGFCGPRQRENVVKGVLGNNALGGVIKGDGLKGVTGLISGDGALGSIGGLGRGGKTGGPLPILKGLLG